MSLDYSKAFSISSAQEAATELHFDQPTIGDILAHRQGLKRRRLARLPIYRERSKDGAPPFSPSAPVQRGLQGPPAKSKFLALRNHPYSNLDLQKILQELFP